MVATVPRFVAFSLVDRAPFLADADAANLLGRAREAVASGRGHHPRTEVLDCLNEAADVLRDAVPLDVARGRFGTVFRGEVDGGHHATELLVDNPRGRPMTPADYLRLILLPTFAEMLSEPTDQRRAYLASITAAHLVDHVAVTLQRRPNGRPDHRAVRSTVGQTAPHGRYSADCLAIIEAVSNGTKHALPDPNPNLPVKFVPGYERLVGAFAWGVEGAGWGEGRWSEPGLVVDHGGGMWFLDDCIRATVRAITAAYPDLFVGADLGAVARELDRYAALDALMPPDATL